MLECVNSCIFEEGQREGETGKRQRDSETEGDIETGGEMPTRLKEERSRERARGTREREREGEKERQRSRGVKK